jgi:hypothetical protein
VSFLVLLAREVRRMKKEFQAIQEVGVGTYMLANLLHPGQTFHYGETTLTVVKVDHGEGGQFRVVTDQCVVNATTGWSVRLV